MTQDKPLTSLKLRRFNVSMLQEDYDRLTALSIRNTVNRSSMGWLILHQWLDDHDAELREHYMQLSYGQMGRDIAEIEHEVLGRYKRMSRAGIEDLEGQGTVKVKFSIPSWDNRRLIGHASMQDVNKPEMWRRAVLPWLKSQDDAIARFWQSACEWLGKSLDETKALLIQDFDQQGR
jgi:hypothetical protein